MQNIYYESKEDERSAPKKRRLSESVSNSFQNTFNGDIKSVLLLSQTHGTSMPSVHHSPHHLHHFLSHLSHSSPRNPLQHLHDPQSLQHHLLLGNRYRELVELRLRQVPSVLRPRRLILEEHRNAAGENPVERRPPRRGVTRRLQAEARLQHRPHESDRIVLANSVRAVHNSA